MDKFLTTLVATVAGYAITYLYLLFNKTAELYRPFPFYKAIDYIRAQVYVDYFCTRIFYCLIFFNLWHLSSEYGPKYQGCFKVFFWLWIGFLIDYIIRYNMAWGKIGKLPISYSLFMGIVMFVTVIIAIFK